MAGVDKFYLYNNDSTDDTEKILEPYIKGGLVDLIYFPGQAKQFPAYNNALKKYRNDCEYMAFVDGDEFIRPIDRSRNIYDVVKEIFSLANSK